MRFLRKRYLLLALCAVGLLALTKEFATSGGEGGEGGEPPGGACTDLVNPAYIAPPFQGKLKVTQEGDQVQGTTSTTAPLKMVGHPECLLDVSYSESGNVNQLTVADMNGTCTQDNIVFSASCAVDITANCTAVQVIGSTPLKSGTTNVVVMCIRER